MNSPERANLIKKLIGFVGAAGITSLMSSPVLAQLNPNPSIFNEPPYNRSRVTPRVTQGLPGTTTPPRTTPATPTRNTQSSLTALDTQFIIEAAQGGMAEVRLGEMAVQRATSEEVRRYAQQMVQDHTRANAELMQLAAQKGVTPPTDLGKYEAVMLRLSEIPSASFDQAYMNEAGVNAHTESEVVYLRQVQLGQDADLRAFATRTLPTVQTHLQMARSMVQMSR